MELREKWVSFYDVNLVTRIDQNCHRLMSLGSKFC